MRLSAHKCFYTVTLKRFSAWRYCVNNTAMRSSKLSWPLSSPLSLFSWLLFLMISLQILLYMRDICFPLLIFSEGYLYFVVLRSLQSFSFPQVNLPPMFWIIYTNKLSRCLQVKK